MNSLIELIQLWAPSSGEMQEFTRDSHSALWGFSSRWAYIGCTLVFAVHCGIEWVHSRTSTRAVSQYAFLSVLVGCFSICVLQRSCILVFSLYVIINRRSSVTILKNASTEDTWKCLDVFLISRMHRVQTWENRAVRNPRRRCGRPVCGSL